MGIWKGVGFGVTSGVITTLGVIIGLHSGTQSKLAVLVGVVVLAIADALSDAMGIHVSEEAENVHTTRELWESAGFTFLSKMLIALSFVIPLYFLDQSVHIFVCIVWGCFLIAVFSYYLARSQGKQPIRIIAEHLLITLLIVVIAHFLGGYIHELFIQ